MVPTVTTLMKIAGALNRSVAYFVEEQEEAKPVVFSRPVRAAPGVHVQDGAWS